MDSRTLHIIPRPEGARPVTVRGITHLEVKMANWEASKGKRYAQARWAV